MTNRNFRTNLGKRNTLLISLVPEPLKWQAPRLPNLGTLTHSHLLHIPESNANQ